MPRCHKSELLNGRDGAKPSVARRRLARHAGDLSVYDSFLTSTPISHIRVDPPEERSEGIHLPGRAGFIGPVALEPSIHPDPTVIYAT
jgi:hypothetical protein